MFYGQERRAKKGRHGRKKPDVLFEVQTVK